MSTYKFENLHSKIEIWKLTFEKKNTKTEKRKSKFEI